MTNEKATLTEQQRADRYETIKAQWRTANKRYYDKVKHDDEFKRKRSEYHRRRYQQKKAATATATAVDARARAACD